MTGTRHSTWALQWIVRPVYPSFSSHTFNSFSFHHSIFRMWSLAWAQARKNTHPFISLYLNDYFMFPKLSGEFTLFVYLYYTWLRWTKLKTLKRNNRAFEHFSGNSASAQSYFMLIFLFLASPDFVILPRLRFSLFFFSSLFQVREVKRESEAITPPEVVSVDPFLCFWFVLRCFVLPCIVSDVIFPLLMHPFFFFL